MSERYPQLEVNLTKLKHNAEYIKNQCDKKGIAIAGVVKGCSGIPSSARVFEDAGFDYIASSRCEEIEEGKGSGINKPTMLLRVPMMSEVPRVLDLFDVSLNSEIEIIRQLDKVAGVLGLKHGVILMADLGDLREGYWDKEEMCMVAKEIEGKLKNLVLEGVATNLGCYGAVEATKEKMEELVEIAENIEKSIGRKLRYIGGGATTTLPIVLNDEIPDRINLLRVGEGILLARDLQELWGYDMSFMHQDVFTLKAQVIEVKDKPSHPVGKIMFDAFGNMPTYEDRGIRKRALIALGKVDYAFCDAIFPRLKGIEVLGASSDHTILDIEEAEKEIKVGDILEFDLCYSSLVYVTHSKNVSIEPYWEG